MVDFDPKMIEAMDTASAPEHRLTPEAIESILYMLPISPDALNALWRGEATVVPKACSATMMRAFWRAGPFPANPFLDGWSAMLVASPYVRKN